MLKNLLRELWLQAWRALVPARGPALRPGETLRQAFDARMEEDDYAGALALAQAAQAAARGADAFEAQLLLGRAYQKLHDAARALACFEAAERLRAGDPDLHDFRGSLYQELGRLPEAFAEYERALALRPVFPLASFHLGMAQLLAGDFARGWEGYDLRRLSAEYARAPAGIPRWDGTPLAGRRLLVTREQGLGDEIMYASMIPELLAQAGGVVLECDPRLAPLLRRAFPAATVFGTEPGGGLPASIAPASIDVQIEAGSLARLLRRRAADFPRHEGYLRADPAQVVRWRERLAELGPGLKVGIAWTGGVRRTRRELRSLDLEQLLPLLRVPGVRFVSLQYTADARDDIEALRARHGIDIAHWPEAIADYDQTAALAGAVDLVVSVCTSLVHLAGALGRPAWVLVPVGPEWRYGNTGTTMPWYPSVRLFRQTAYRDWEPVIAAVAAELHGTALALQGRYEDAINPLGQALCAAAPHAATANLLGLCCSLVQRHEDALRHYDAALAAEPALADALANAGWSATLAGRADANRYFRRWLDLKAVPLHGARPVAPAGKPRLAEVTLACVDCVYHEHAANALRTSLARCDFGRALFLSDRDCGVPGVEFAAIERIASREGYSNFMIHRLHEHVRTSHVLVIQYDGFVLNPGAWDPAFLDYDYIGPAVRFEDGRAGGIGGFSLRSRRLLAALRDDPQIQAYDAAKVNYPEDVAICWSFRNLLETRHGIRFAPGEVADRFAAEAIAPTASSFGFHNLMHLVCLYQNEFRLPASAADGIRISFRASTALGEVRVQREVELHARGDSWPRFFPAG